MRRDNVARMPAATGEPTAFFTTFPVLLAITAVLVVAAFLVNRFVPKKRRHVRRTAIMFILYIVAFVVSISLRVLKDSDPVHTTRQVAELLGLLTSVNIGALLIFDLGFAAIGVEVATIATDLAIGLAYVVAVVSSMSRFGFQLSSIVTTSALMTTIIAFSLQSSLSNIVGGVALQIDDSIHPGDWVQLENGKQGKVKAVRWRYTVIETRDWDTIIVPNATLLAQNVIILGKREGEPVQHRMWVYFNVDFRFAPGDVIRAVNEALQAAPIEGVADEPKPHAIVYDFAKDTRDSFAYYAVRYWLTDLAKDDPTSSRVRERIFSALRRANIPLAMPGHMVWVEQDGGEHRSRKEAREMERRMRTLSQVSILKPLRREELEHIAAGLRYAPFAAGETITKQGAVAHWLYILETGTAEVKVRAVNREEKSVAKITAPGFFGEMGLMAGEERKATVLAVTDCVCYRLDKETFHKIITERPEIAKELSELLAQRSVELEAIREDLDEGARASRIETEQGRIFKTIQSFFGLRDDTQ